MQDRAKDEPYSKTVHMGSVVGLVTKAVMTIGASVHQVLQSERAMFFSQNMARIGRFIREHQSEIGSFVETLQRLPDDLQETASRLAQRGWFVDDEMGLSSLRSYRSLVQDDAFDQIDALMVAHFEHQLDNIEERLVALAPHRARILRSTFCAVRRGDDDLAIPTLLMQADGLCYDHGLGDFFRRDRPGGNIPRAMKQLQDNGVTPNPLFSPVFHVLPLYMSFDERRREKSFHALNRHQVLHGESIDYGTHENSLRAVSFLNCIALLLMDSKNPENEAIEVAKGESRRNRLHS